MNIQNHTYLLNKLLSGITLTLLSTFFCVLPALAAPAQGLLSDLETPKVSLLSKGISLAQLPAPGLPIELKAELINTKDFRQPLRLLLVRDGQFQEIITPPGLPDFQEKPQYSVTVLSPLAELSYQFIQTLPDGSVVSSARHTVRRDCIPDITPALEQIGSEVTGDDRMLLLVKENRKIESEIANLQASLEKLDSLTALLVK